MPSVGVNDSSRLDSRPSCHPAEGGWKTDVNPPLRPLLSGGISTQASRPACERRAHVRAHRRFLTQEQTCRSTTRVFTPEGCHGPSKAPRPLPHALPWKPRERCGAEERPERTMERRAPRLTPPLLRPSCSRRPAGLEWARETVPGLRCEAQRTHKRESPRSG